MKKTTNYQLNKPELAEQYDIDNFNDNADKIDETMHNTSDKLDNEIRDRKNAVIDSAHGGSGKKTLQDSANAYLDSTSVDSADVTDNTNFITSNASGTNTYHKRKATIIWKWIQSKISSVLGLTKDNYGGKASKSGIADLATNVQDGAKMMPSNKPVESVNYVEKTSNLYKKWLRVAQIPRGNYGANFDMYIQTSYSNIPSMSAKVNIAYGYQNVCITQISCKMNIYNVVDAVRVVQDHDKNYYVDIHYNSNVYNMVQTKIVGGDVIMQNLKEHAEPAATLATLTLAENKMIINNDKQVATTNQLSDGAVTKIANNCTNVAGKSIATTDGTVENANELVGNGDKWGVAFKGTGDGINNAQFLTCFNEKTSQLYPFPTSTLFRRDHMSFDSGSGELTINLD